MRARTATPPHGRANPIALGSAGFRTVSDSESPTSRQPDNLDGQTIRRVDEPETTTVRRGRELQRRRHSTARPGPRVRTKADSAQTAEILAVIQQRLKLLEQGGDHFSLLGVPQDVSADLLRKAYFALARKLHPDRLSALGIADDARDAQRLFAQVNMAFATLSDPKRRFDYTHVLRRGGESAVRAEEARASEMANRVLDAEEAFRRGEQAQRRDQLGTAIAEFSRAVELNPDEADYHAAVAWAQFCASQDKMAIAAATRAALEGAIQKSPKAPTARVFLGRVERMLGRDVEALHHFQEVLKIAPTHPDATAEIRVIEARMASGDKPSGGGLFGRNKR